MGPDPSAITGFAAFAPFALSRRNIGALSAPQIGEGAFACIVERGCRDSDDGDLREVAERLEDSTRERPMMSVCCGRSGAIWQR
jgi:hypothetical protein